jgi:hypothetical protein
MAFAFTRQDRQRWLSRSLAGRGMGFPDVRSWHFIHVESCSDTGGLILIRREGA